MSSVLRALPLALGSMLAVHSTRAQPAELPAIFAPRVASAPTATPTETPASVASVPSTLVSDRVRSMVTAAATHALAHAEVFEATVVTASDPVFVTKGTTMMAPMVVRSRTLRARDVLRPTVQLLRFERVGADLNRRLAGGVTGPLFHMKIGDREFQVDFSILNGAGRGLDHGRDFVRMELSFSLKF